MLITNLSKTENVCLVYVAVFVLHQDSGALRSVSGIRDQPAFVDFVRPQGRQVQIDDCHVAQQVAELRIVAIPDGDVALGALYK